LKDSDDKKSWWSSIRSRRQLRVVDATGRRRRFLRGMITHDLVQRGIGFDDAYRIARAIREQIGDRSEVTTAEIRAIINEHLAEMYGPELPASLTLPVRPTAAIQVTYHGQPQPFSRGLLARSIHAAGVDLDRAYSLVTELESSLLTEGRTAVSSNEIARRADQLLETFVGPPVAKRYRLLRRIHNLPRPLVIYVGGASGTGKSTLALELAPLLRIYRINATDTIRQVMRMVFTPSIMPMLHASSFEAADYYGVPGLEEAAGGEHDTDQGERLITSFEEQAKRVCVGVRAVVERAISENMSIVVEGVHLVPGLIPFADLEGAAYQVPLVLATLDEEAHRARFLARARRGGRRAERYLENFDSIRAIHDYILLRAETHEVPELETSSGDVPVIRTLQLVTGMLENRLPSLSTASQTTPEEWHPTLLLIIDGLPDRPVRELGGRTPLQAAETPVLDRLAREGRSGLADPVAPGVVPDTAAGTLALLGQSPLALKRGPVEAIGAGLSLSAGDVALRGNFATVDASGQVIDRRAGRIRVEAAQLAEAIDRLPLAHGLSRDVEVRARVATEHRLAIVIRGEGLSPDIEGSDPGEGALPAEPLTPRPIDPNNSRAIRTARVLALFEKAAREVLEAHPINAERRRRGLPPANAVLTRGAGRIHRLIPLEESGLPLRIVCISGDRTVLGLTSWLGAHTITSDEMTANLDTDLAAKFDAAVTELERNDLVILHVKGADIAAHDRRPEQKVAFLESIDAQLGRLLERHKAPLRVAVASDHATLSESGQHAADPLPVMIWGPGIKADEVGAFDEQSAANGALERFPLQLLLGKLFDLT
jgi:2,3-bisphosphoglycerate-independent phosphoglycerate mutase